MGLWVICFSERLPSHSRRLDEMIFKGPVQLKPFYNTLTVKGQTRKLWDITVTAGHLATTDVGKTEVLSAFFNRKIP